MLGVCSRGVPAGYFQKQFFDGKVHELSTDDYVMRYDVEVSGFPSSHAGHLSLLALTEDDYKGTERIEEWPSWDLPVLQWAKRAGRGNRLQSQRLGVESGWRRTPQLQHATFRWYRCERIYCGCRS